MIGKNILCVERTSFDWQTNSLLKTNFLWSAKDILCVKRTTFDQQNYSLLNNQLLLISKISDPKKTVKHLVEAFQPTTQSTFIFSPQFPGPRHSSGLNIYSCDQVTCAKFTNDFILTSGQWKSKFNPVAILSTKIILISYP